MSEPPRKIKLQSRLAKASWTGVLLVLAASLVVSAALCLLLRGTDSGLSFAGRLRSTLNAFSIVSALSPQLA